MKTKKSIAIIVLLAIAIALPAQRRKPAYVEIDLAGSMLGMPYDKGTASFVRGGLFDVGARYSLLFDGRKGWGVTAGLGFATFQGGVNLNRTDSFPSIDSEGDPYLLKVDMENWNEKQQSYYLTIPISVFFQQIQRMSSGWFTSLGFKAYIPLAGSYSAAGGLTTAGAYDQWGGVLMENLPQHGFGYYENFKPSGKIKPNFMLSAQFVFGAVIHIDRRNEAFVAGFVEHGIFDAFKPTGARNSLLKVAEENKAIDMPFEYTSYYQSTMSKKSIPLMVGIRLGWRFRDVHGCNCIR